MKFAQTLAAVAALALALAGCGNNMQEAAPQAATSTTTVSASRAALVASDYRTAVQQLYISYFGRPADTGGLANFTADLARMGGPTDIQGLNDAYDSTPAIRSLIDGFGVSPESAALYSGDNNTFVTAIYTNVLGRAPDADGKAFWVNAIDRGTLTRARASLSIMAGALVNQTAQGLLDAELINKRITVGSNFTTALDTTAEQSAYSGDPAAATARAMLASVTASTDPATFQGLIDTTIGTLLANSVSYSQVRAIINQRCLLCHSNSTAQAGISWVSDETVHARASDINRVVFVERSMPFQNATNMTDAERTIINNWFLAGAP